MSTSNNQCGDLVASWDIPHSAHNHRVEFEHGTTTGRRVIRVDGQDVLRKDWMFKLVGAETFEVHDGQMKCEIFINATSGFSYEYALLVNGKSLRKFKEDQIKLVKTWIVDARMTSEYKPLRIVLEKESLDVWANGIKLETSAHFVDEGTEITFVLSPFLNLPESNARIRTISSGNKKEGIIYTLLINDQQIDETIG